MDMRRDVHGFDPLGSEEGTHSSNNVGDGEKRTLERESPEERLRTQRL